MAWWTKAATLALVIYAFLAVFYSFVNWSSAFKADGLIAGTGLILIVFVLSWPTKISPILGRTESFFKTIRPFLIRAIAAYEEGNIEWPASSNSYEINLDKIHEIMQSADEDGTLRSISKDASQLCEALRDVDSKYKKDLDDIDGDSLQIFQGDAKLLALIRKAVEEIDSWLDKWQK